MSYRDRNHEKPIIAHLIEEKGAAWSEETRKVTWTDSQRILEALIAEIGIESSVSALDRQGFSGAAYRSLIRAIHKEAVRRRGLIE